MVRKIILSTMGFFIVLGVIMIAWNFMTGEDTLSFISTHYVGNTDIVMYEIDIHGYIENLELTLTEPFRVDWITEPDEPVWDWTDAIIAIKMVVKGLEWVVNWLIWILNASILLPVKIIEYILMILMSILGLNLTGSNINLGLAFEFNIPYLSYNW